MPEEEAVKVETPEKTTNETSLFGEDRDALEELYEKQGDEDATLDEKTEVSEEDLETEALPEEEPETETKEDEAFTEEEMASVKRYKETHGFIEHGAFHEERERRKTLQSKVTELEGQLKTVLTDYKAMIDVDPQSKKEGEDEEYLDPNILAIKKQNLALQQRLDKIEQSSQRNTAAAQKKKHQENITNTSKALSDEGFPGFEFAIASVAQTLMKLHTEDPETAPPDTPEGWKKVYKEHVFPNMRKLFDAQNRETDFEKKKRLKEKAGLTGKTGKKPAPEKAEDAKTTEELYNDYLKMRRSHSPL